MIFNVFDHIMCYYFWVANGNSAFLLTKFYPQANGWGLIPETPLGYATVLQLS